MDNFQLKEFQKKYSGTCARVLNLITNKVMAVQFANIPGSCSAESPYVALSSAWKAKKTEADVLLGNNSTTNKNFQLKNIQVLPTPEKQVFDFGNRTFVYNKNPQRQWQSGINGNNSLFHDPIGILLLGLPNTVYAKFRDRPTLIPEIRCLENLLIENHAGSLTKAISDIKKYTLLSRTLDKTYFLALSINEDYPYILYRYHIPVAYYDDVLDIFTLTKGIFSQEISDFCRRRNLFSSVREV